VPTGIVKWYNEGLGRGIIIPDEGGAEIGVEPSDIVGHGFRILDEGQRVMFEVAQHGKQRRAKQVVALTRGLR
jgi:CspA family cold shock protein